MTLFAPFLISSAVLLYFVSWILRGIIKISLHRPVGDSSTSPQRRFYADTGDHSGRATYQSWNFPMLSGDGSAVTIICLAPHKSLLRIMQRCLPKFRQLGRPS